MSRAGAPGRAISPRSIDSFAADRASRENFAVAAVLVCDASSTDPVTPQLKRTASRMSRALIAVDTRWRAQEWRTACRGRLILIRRVRLAEETIGAFSEGRARPPRRARSAAAAGRQVAHSRCPQPDPCGEHENHTYCHSVNVAILSLLLSRQAGLDEPTVAQVVEGALLHDVGKTRIPIGIIKKPYPPKSMIFDGSFVQAAAH